MNFRLMGYGCVSHVRHARASGQSVFGFALRAARDDARERLLSDVFSGDVVPFAFLAPDFWPPALLVLSVDLPLDAPPVAFLVVRGLDTASDFPDCSALSAFWDLGRVVADCRACRVDRWGRLAVESSAGGSSIGALSDVLAVRRAGRVVGALLRRASVCSGG